MPNANANANTSMSTIKCISRTWLDRNYSQGPNKLTARADRRTPCARECPSPFPLPYTCPCPYPYPCPSPSPCSWPTHSSHDQFDNSLMRNEEIAQLLLAVHPKKTLPPLGYALAPPPSSTVHPSWWLKTQPHCGLVIISNECAAVSVSVLILRRIRLAPAHTPPHLCPW